jgi:Na+/melibiose symporter-like transporter
LAYDLESLLSPMIAAALLTVINYQNLFVGTVIGFLVSAVLVSLSRFPVVEVSPPTPFVERLTRGVRVFWTSAELRGLMGLNLVVAATTAMVIVNTVVLVQGDLGRAEADVALMLGAYGGGSMLVALLVPKLLETVPDRLVMLTGGVALPVLLLLAPGLMAWVHGTLQWAALLATWVLLGAATSAVLTPSARLLRRGSTEQSRPAVFAAQFSLSHACFLLTYPLAGILGAAIGVPAVSLVLVVIGAIGVVVALVCWRRPLAAGRYSEVT